MADDAERPATADAGNGDIAGMSFEQALEALEKIVDDLERGDVPLDQSIRIYERGEALKKHCDRLLRAAEDKVEKIRLSREGQAAGTEPLDPQ
ncbi:exodeoxyribonuclease VII small subunit [Aquibium sp. A9E412]|uniref:exodeoxyribonuclease VII small subunit n=1 Tax=Aquibium sp. A9E412 TaxID=2976767 RepID=UPI0025B16A7F|nr:exodeoxyribonuclease VII small subunit [Aquibium sp. A9E412]MDN2567941.1 exodeoxyribonuclease VII small subunit [Aquibium sp. A9E412]